MSGITFDDGTTLDQLIEALQEYRRDDRGGMPVTLYAYMCPCCEGENCDPAWFEVENVKHSNGIEIRLRVMG